jgi:MFS family permease
LAFGGIVVPKLNLLLMLICRPYLAGESGDGKTIPLDPFIPGVDNPQCHKIPQVQAAISNFTLYMNLISGLLAAITSPMLGALSDRYGRKLIIAGTSMGTLVGEIIIIFAATYPDHVSVNWVLVGQAFDGLFGSFIAAMAVSFAYTSDCYPPAERHVKFAYLYGCLFTGIAVGPILSAYVIEATGTLTTMLWVALVCHSTFILFIIFVVPESLSKRRQYAAKEKHRIVKEEAGHVSWLRTLREVNLFAPLKILFPTGPGSNTAVRMNLLLLASVDTIMFGVAMGAMTIVLIYSEYAFGWANLDASMFISIVNICRVIMLFVTLPLATRLVRGKASSQPLNTRGSDLLDLYLIRVAVFFDMLGCLGYTLARTGPLFTLSGVTAAIGSIGSPTITSALTKHVPADRTGQILGAMGLLHALARVVAPTLFHTIFSATVGKFDQTVFVCLTAMFGIAFILSLFIRPHGKLVYISSNGSF